MLPFSRCILLHILGEIKLNLMKAEKYLKSFFKLIKKFMMPDIPIMG